MPNLVCWQGGASFIALPIIGIATSMVTYHGESITQSRISRRVS